MAALDYGYEITIAQNAVFDPNGVATNQWQRQIAGNTNWENIVGETGQTHVIDESDRSAKIRLVQSLDGASAISNSLQVTSDSPLPPPPSQNGGWAVTSPSGVTGWNDFSRDHTQDLIVYKDSTLYKTTNGTSFSYAGSFPDPGGSGTVKHGPEYDRLGRVYIASYHNPRAPLASNASKGSASYSEIFNSNAITGEPEYQVTFVSGGPGCDHVICGTNGSRSLLAIDVNDRSKISVISKGQSTNYLSTYACANASINNFHVYVGQVYPAYNLVCYYYQNNTWNRRVTNFPSGYTPYYERRDVIKAANDGSPNMLCLIQDSQGNNYKFGRSENYGQTWSFSNPNSNMGYVTTPVSFGGKNWLCCASRKDYSSSYYWLWYSQDNGLTWNMVEGSSEFNLSSFGGNSAMRYYPHSKRLVVYGNTSQTSQKLAYTTFEWNP